MTQPCPGWVGRFFERIERIHVWKTISHCHMYEININGDIKSKYTNKLIKKHPDKDGYFRVALWYNNKIHNFLLHRLLAQHFIPNNDSINLNQVNHIDGNKQNNNIINLEWVSLTENRRHAFRTGLQTGKKGLKHHNTKLNEDDVYKIRKYCDNGIKHDIIAKMYNIGKSAIQKIGSRTRWKHLEEKNEL